MPQVSLTLNKDEIQEAICFWVEHLGYATSDRFSVMVRVDKGDRPGDVDHVTATVTGVFPAKAP